MKIDPVTFIGHLENVIENLPPGTLQPGTKLADIPQLDSLAMLSILAIADMEYGVQITGREFQSCETIGDIIGVLEKKTA